MHTQAQQIQHEKYRVIGVSLYKYDIDRYVILLVRSRYNLLL